MTETEPEEFKDHCGFCDRDIVSFAGPPTMCVVTVRSEDNTLDATYSGVCLTCAIAVIQTLGSRRGAPGLSRIE